MKWYKIINQKSSNIEFVILHLFQSMQMVDGLFSIAVALALAITIEMTKSLYVLLRISFLTGPFVSYSIYVN